MAAETTRVKDIPTTATTAAADDYVLLDGATNGTRKGLASNLITPAAHNADAGAHGVSELQAVIWGDSLTQRCTDVFATTQLGKVLSEYALQARGVGGESSIGIKARFDAEPSLHTATTIIWAGTNNKASTAQVLADVSAMVGALTHQRYLVLSVFNSSAETVGTAGHTSMLATNAALAAAFGSKYFDIRTWFVGQYDPEVPQDVLDFANDILPSSLRTDTLHPNYPGVALLVQKIAELVRAAYPVPAGLPVTLPLPVRNLNISRGKLLKDGLPILSVDDLQNVALGRSTADGNVITTGANNVSVGFNALATLTTGVRNVAVGNFAGVLLTTGSDNILLGDRAGGAITTSYGNVCASQYAGQRITTGPFNVALGYSALNYVTTGANNVAIGGYAGAKLTLAAGTNTFIGNQAGNGASQKVDAANSTAIGNGANTTASNQVVVGNDSVTEMRVGGTGAGIVLKSPDGNAYRITVANGGTLTVAAA